MDGGIGKPLYIVFEEELSEGMSLEDSPDKTYALRLEIST